MDANPKDAEEPESEATTSEVFDPLKICYFCDKCQQKLFLTSTEILRHRRSHQTSTCADTKPNVDSQSKSNEMSIESEVKME